MSLTIISKFSTYELNYAKFLSRTSPNEQYARKILTLYCDGIMLICVVICHQFTNHITKSHHVKSLLSLIQYSMINNLHTNTH